MRRFLIAASALALAACAAETPQPTMTLDEVAEAYVKTSLEIGTHEDGYIDAYYGPAEWQEEATAHPRDKAALKAEVERLRSALKLIEPDDELLVARRDFLDAQLRAAGARLEMMDGKVYPFDEEARLLYGAAPPPHELSEFDPLLERLDALLPGDGPVSTRVAAYNSRFVIPDDKVEAAILAATAACKAKSAEHIAMPEGEDFKLELVRDKVWSGYNWYKGNAQSLIQVNLDSDVTPDRAISLGCHEGYPGHHLFNALLEEKLSKGRGWVEYQVYPLFSPQSLIAEGSADYGRLLAFDDDETLALLRDTLFPIAGLDPAEAERYREVIKATSGLDEANLVIARAYLDGKADKAATKAALMKYRLSTDKQADRNIAFFDANRSYSINYVTGEQLVTKWIEARGKTRDEKWKAMETLLSTPVVLGE